MGVMSVTVPRVSSTLRADVILSNLGQTASDLLTLQNQLSSGKQIQVPSDSPYDATVANQLQDYIEQKTRFQQSIQSATAVLNTADSALADATNIVTDAKQTGLGEIGTTATAATRKSAAAILDEAIKEMVSIGNTQFAGRYIFAGRDTLTAPFQNAGGGIYFGGDTGTVRVSIDSGSSAMTSVNAAGAFGAVSSQVKGDKDLNPSISAQTLLSDLNRGAGVAKGSITISDGLNTTTVDLSDCATVGDVLAKVNSQVPATTHMSMNGYVLEITTARPGGSITVNNALGGTTATDLGLYSPTGAGHTLMGSDLDPRVTPLTPLNVVGGIDLGSGVIITNGGITKTVAFTGCSTVQDILNRINQAGLYVEAKVNDAGTGIDVVSRLSGASLTIGENGGTTAADLGIRSLTAATALKDLNNGLGVSTVSGDDITITLMDGTSFGVDLTSCATMGDVIDAINNAAGNGGNLTASLVTTGNGLQLTDNTGGAGTLSVARANASQAADDLGLMATASAGTITGQDINPVRPDGVFSDLLGLRDALLANDSTKISYYTGKLDGDSSKIVESRASIGASQQRVSTVSSRITSEMTELQTLLSNKMDVDYAAATVRFSTLQASFQAGLQTAGSILQMSLLNFLK